MTIGTGTEVLGDFLGLADDVEAEAHAHARREADFRQVAELVRGHLLQGRRLEEALPIQFAVIE